MEKIKISDKAVKEFKARKPESKRPRTALRLAIDGMKPGDALIINQGVDYYLYRNVYHILRQVQIATGYSFRLTEAEDQKSALITCE